jgi:hypothetical protein
MSPNAAGVREGVNLQYVEIIYRAAAGVERRLALEVSYTPRPRHHAISQSP